MDEGKINKRSKKNRKGKDWIFTIVMVIGFSIAVYPAISQYYYARLTHQVNNDFEEAKSKLDTAEVDRRLDLAMAYNETLDPTVLADPFNERHKEGKAEYARMLELHEQIGHVRITKINQDIPMYAGTSEFVLQKGAGHLEGTSLPVGGLNTHTVITAHRGLPSARLFTDLDKIKEGDKFYVHNIKEILCYQVDQIQVVEPSNFEPIFIVEGKDYATLLTCTPYMINSQRLLVRGIRVPYVAEIEEKEIKTIEDTNKYKKMFYLTAGILGIVLARICWKKYKKVKWQKNHKG